MQKNCILITIDCLRADHLSCYGYNRKTSPFIDYVADHGIKFVNAFANGPNTPPAFRAILASGYCFEFTLKEPLAPETPLISEILQKRGIKTVAIHSNPFLSAFYGYNRGWSYFKDFMSSNLDTTKQPRLDFNHLVTKYLPQQIHELTYAISVLINLYTKPYVEAETVTQAAIQWLKSNKNSSFFLWIHYMDLHEPYIIFNTYLHRHYSQGISKLKQIKLDRTWSKLAKKGAQDPGGLHTKTEHSYDTDFIREVVNIYDDKLYYIDENLTKLFFFLEKEGLLDRTFLILTSDHGQEFLEHGGVGHGRGNLHDEIIHIPLVLFGLGQKKREEKCLVSQLDIAPTILQFFEINSPKEIRGKPLINNDEDKNHYVISEGYTYAQSDEIYAVRTETWKYIRTIKKNYVTLYNLGKDPKETKNLIDEEKEKARELEAIINKHLLQEEKIRMQRTLTYEKERIRRRLKKLKRHVSKTFTY